MRDDSEIMTFSTTELPQPNDRITTTLHTPAGVLKHEWRVSSRVRHWRVCVCISRTVETRTPVVFVWCNREGDTL
jgi:hypothetical protein